MKKWFALALVAMVAAGAAQAADNEPLELGARAQVWFPGEGDFNLFEPSVGAVVTLRDWFAFPWGVTLDAGIAQWRTDSDSNPYKYKGLNDFDGDVTVIPVGLSLNYCLIDWNDWDVNLSTGLKYVFVDSDADCHSDADGKRHGIDMDNAIWWTVEAEFDYQVFEGGFLTCGGGFQTDVMRSDTKCNGAELRDSRFQGFFANLGFKFLL